MVEDKRIGWIRDLVVGDRVSIVTALSSYFSYRVSKITASGVITVENPAGKTYVFNPSGSLRGSDRYSRIHLYQYDEVKHQEYKRNKDKSRLIGEVKDLLTRLNSATVDDDAVNQLRGMKFQVADLIGKFSVGNN